MLGLLSPVAVGQATATLRDSIERLVERRLSGAYMMQSCEPVTTFKNWVGVELQACRYNSGKLTAKVILIRPKSRIIATWIFNACEEVFGVVTENCARRLADRMNCQSNYQFPVAGIVIENDQNYAFRDGVTVRIRGIQNGSSNQLDDAAIEKSLKPKLKAGDELLEAWKFARLQGTTREEYRGAGGTLDVSGLKWLEVVRNSFQAALKSDRNELLVAWLKSHQGPSTAHKASTSSVGQRDGIWADTWCTFGAL